jgi:hypothetical protein
MNPEALYMQLGRLAAAIPKLDDNVLSSDAQQWLGRLDALLTANDSVSDLMESRTAAGRLINATTPAERFRAANSIVLVLHRALAAAELHAPVSAQGSFIAAGNALDAMAAIGKVLQTAKRDVLIVDPYMDEKALIDFAPLTAESIAVRLLADQQWHKPTLGPAKQRWTTQYGASRPPLEVRLTAPKTLHDRLIVVDDKDAYVLTQSLNAFAARSPATIARVDSETSALKISAYAAIWDAATPLP